MVQTMVRHWCNKRLQPCIPALESGQEMPFALMREMVRTFGLDALATQAARRRIERLRRGEVPQGEGGESPAGDDPMMAYVLIKELARVSPGFAMGLGVTLGLAGGTILARGTAEQIERFALPLLSCDKIGSWCLTEPEAGSDALGSMRTTARPCTDEGGGYILSGSKTFVTNGPGADLFVVYARIDHGGPREQQPIGAFVLERGMPGLSIGQPFKKMGMRDSPTCALFFDEVRVPADHLLGGPQGADAGRRDVKQGLLGERAGVPAMAWGIVERCYELSRDHALRRQQFGRPIGEFQAVQLKLADLFLKLRLVESVVFRIAWLQQSGTRDDAFVMASKAFCAQCAVEAAMTAIQIHGGYGYMEEFHLEKLARDAKLLELGAGTSDINLLTAARLELGLTPGV